MTNEHVNSTPATSISTFQHFLRTSAKRVSILTAQYRDKCAPPQQIIVAELQYAQLNQRVINAISSFKNLQLINNSSVRHSNYNAIQKLLITTLIVITTIIIKS